MSTVVASEQDNESGDGPINGCEPILRTELDSHANMVVLGSNAFIFYAAQDQTCDIQPYDPSIGKATSAPIVDGAVACDCPISNKMHVLAFHNALHVPALQHNLIPPFTLREASLEFNGVAKMNVP